MENKSKMRRKTIVRTAIAGVLACCLCFVGCGEGASDRDTEIEDSGSATGGLESATPSPPTPSPQLSPEEYLRAPMPEQHVPEGREIITIGTRGKVAISDPLYWSVTAFNQAQDKYFVRIDIYGSYDKLLLDIVRKQGTDLYDIGLGFSVEDLVSKGILEDLTPWFDGSGTVGREDVVDAVWRAGSVDDKMYFVIPAFTCNGILVEKGYTKDGAWSGRDYLDLGKIYPGSMLNSGITIPSQQILSELKLYMEAFINWEERTCSFDSAEFIALLEDLKALSSYRYEAVDRFATPAELLRGKIYLTSSVSLSMSSGMRDYRDVRDAFGDNYEIAGMPTADGSLRYSLVYDEMYGMNAASGKKEGAWAFLEYLLSEEYQKPYLPKEPEGYNNRIGLRFPARKDSLEQGLQANIDFVDDKVVYVQNRYTLENQEGYAGFTEEDKRAVQRIIDNAYRSSFPVDYILIGIMFEEAEPFFQGQKSAQDVVKIIQSKLSLYLME